MMEEFDFDLFALALASAQLATQLGALLKDGIENESNFLALQGFVVPSPDALDHAAGVFGAVGQMVAPTPVRFEDASLRLDQICALGTALSGIAREFDMSWSSLWDQSLRGGMQSIELGATSAMGEIWAMHFKRPSNLIRVSEAALRVLHAFNQGLRVELLEKMTRALSEARSYEGYIR
jgi:hypothetical protein